MINVTLFGRLVSGGIEMREKTDNRTKEVILDKDGNPVMEQYLGLAIEKDSEEADRMWTALYGEAYEGFPKLFDAADGNTKYRDFSWKVTDGDGHNAAGESFADREGYADHWVLNLTSSYPAKCYPSGMTGPHDQLAQPEDVIKRGHYICVAVTFKANGVKPEDKGATCGVYARPALVEHKFIAPEITSGPKASEAFANTSHYQAPPGAMGPPTPRPAGRPAPTAGGRPAPSPGGRPAPTPGGRPAPAPGGAGRPLPPKPGMPPKPTPKPKQPELVETQALIDEGFTVQQMLDSDWTEEGLVDAGYAVWQ